MRRRDQPGSWRSARRDQRSGQHCLCIQDPKGARQGDQYFTKAHELSHEIGDRKGEGLALLSIGVTHEELKQYPEALKFFTASEAVHDAVWATLRTDYHDRIS